YPECEVGQPPKRELQFFERLFGRNFREEIERPIWPRVAQERAERLAREYAERRAKEEAERLEEADREARRRLCAIARGGNRECAEQRFGTEAREEAQRKAQEEAAQQEADRKALEEMVRKVQEETQAAANPDDAKSQPVSPNADAPLPPPQVPAGEIFGPPAP